MGEVVELRDPRGIKLFNRLMSMYHRQGSKPGLAKSRYFVYVVDGYWVAGAMLQPPHPFISIFYRFNLDTKRSYFIRRIAKFCPGDHLVEFLSALAERLRAEGKELLVTLGLDGHTNALYRHAGFQEIGLTANGKPVYVLRLQG